MSVQAAHASMVVDVTISSTCTDVPVLINTQATTVRHVSQNLVYSNISACMYDYSILRFQFNVPV